MIITISGTPGSGKSTVAKEVAKRLKLRHFSAGDFMRELAAERGISLLELSKLAEQDESIDREIDERNKRLAAEDNFVIDTRLGFHFIPNSVKIFLKVSVEEAARRIFSDVVAKRRGQELEFKSEVDVVKAIERRMLSERERYQQYYSINHYDESNYDFVLDTSDLSIEECVERVLDFVKNRH